MPYRVGMSSLPLALTTDDARTIGTAVIVACIALGLLSAWVMKTIVQKVILVLVLGGLALAVYSQRTALDQCATDISATLGSTSGDATCSFFGVDVNLPVSIDR